MNIQSEKLELLKTISNIKDESLILDLKAFIDNRSIDWFDELNDDQKKKLKKD